MKRIQIILGALTIVVTSFATVSGPAMAEDLNCRDARGDLIRCDGDLYSPYDDDGYYFYNDNYWDDADYFSPFFFSPYSYYYGDFDDYSYGCEGPVCLID